MSGRRGKIRKTRYTDYARWVGLPHYMLKCVVWAGSDDDKCPVAPLMATAKAVLIGVWQRYNGMNNGEIGYGVREAKALGVNKNQACEAFDQLIERGFLRIGTDSTFDQKRLSRTWIITALPMSNARQATKDFMSWRPALQSRGRDYETDPKNKTQSRPRDTQSRPRDYDHKNHPESAPTVPPAGLEAVEPTPLQSRPRDTSILPSGDSGGMKNGHDADARLSKPTCIEIPRPKRRRPPSEAA
jgi:hypothetical protein